MLRTAVEIAAGVTMIAMGILFFVYIPSNALNLATNVIFVGAGVMIIRRGFTMYKQARTQHQVEEKRNERMKRKQTTRR